VGFGDIGGGVTFDLMERDLFGGNAGGRLELFVASIELGVVVIERLKKEYKFFILYFSSILFAKNICIIKVNKDT